MFNGLIYKYVSPSNKVYIGQTINEPKRRRTFKNINMRYAGGKIDAARLKYSPENFQYSVLEIVETDSKIDLLNKLNELEIYYIYKYDSFNNGYNSTLGGNNGHVFSENEKEHLSTKLAHSVIQYDLDGNFIRIWKSCREIEKNLGYSRVPIQKCCRGEIQHSREFIWKYYDSENFNEQIDGLKENKNFNRKENIILKQQCVTVRDNKTLKRILQYDLKGNFIKEWESITEASEFYNIKNNSLSQCCNGVSKTCGGFVWKFYTNKYPLKIEINLTNSQLLKAATLSNSLCINKYDLKMHLIASYKNVKEAADANLLKTTQITDCLSGRRKTCKNFIWTYEIHEYKKNG